MKTIPEKLRDYAEWLHDNTGHYSDRQLNDDYSEFTCNTVARLLGIDKGHEYNKIFSPDGGGFVWLSLYKSDNPNFNESEWRQTAMCLLAAMIESEDV